MRGSTSPIWFALLLASGLAGVAAGGGCSPADGTSDGDDNGPKPGFDPARPGAGGGDEAGAGGSGNPGTPDGSDSLPDAGPDATPLEPRTSSVITFEPSARFAARECTLTVRFQGNARSVRIAGEFTNWATDARPLTRNGDAFEITLEPTATLKPGELYGYKLIVDDVWTIDPEARYRKLVGDQMNSGLRLPECTRGPEILTSKLTVTPTVSSSGVSGTARVRVEVRAPSGGPSPKRLIASLDGRALAASTYEVDEASGAVTFTVPGIAKGKHRLSLRAEDDAGRTAEPVDLPFWVEEEAFDYRDGLIYMFMMDRYANGDRSNDRPVGGPVDYDADFHGGDLQGALAVMKSGYFEKLGVRTIWLSPLNAQTSKHHPGSGNQQYSAYHGYWPIKAREVEPRFGGDAALRAFVREAHGRGIRVLLDLINNQVHEDHEYIGPNASWFRTSCKCGDIGCGWSERPFECMFERYLPDIDWTKPGAEKRFIDDAVFWIDEFDLDGFRVDAVKHVESNSIYNMRAELARRFEQGGERIFMVGETAVGEGDRGTFFGETFRSGFEWIDAYTGPNALDGQFDFPTRHNMADGLVNGERPLNEVEGELRKAETRYRPGNRHVRFLNGHDNPRIASIAARDPRLGCTWASGCRGTALPPLTYSDPEVYVRLKRALTVLYTMPGVPFLYAGDEVAFGGGADPDMRRDMLFAEPELAPLQMTRPSLSPRALSLRQVDLRDYARKLGAARSASRAIRRGERMTLLGNESNLWVYAYQTGPKEVAVIAVNRGPAVDRIVPTGSLSLGEITSFRSATDVGAATKVTGGVRVALGPGEATIFVGE